LTSSEVIQLDTVEEQVSTEPKTVIEEMKPVKLDNVSDVVTVEENQSVISEKMLSMMESRIAEGYEKKMLELEERMAKVIEDKVTQREKEIKAQKEKKKEETNAAIKKAKEAKKKAKQEKAETNKLKKEAKIQKKLEKKEVKPEKKDAPKKLKDLQKSQLDKLYDTLGESQIEEKKSEEPKIEEVDMMKEVEKKAEEAVKANETKVEEKKDNTEEKAVHKWVICDVCGMDPIKGIRYKCFQCGDYDLCENCNPHHHQHHIMLRIAKPEVLVNATLENNGLIEVNMGGNEMGTHVPPAPPAPQNEFSHPPPPHHGCPWGRARRGHWGKGGQGGRWNQGFQGGRWGQGPHCGGMGRGLGGKGKNPLQNLVHVVQQNMGQIFNTNNDVRQEPEMKEEPVINVPEKVTKETEVITPTKVEPTKPQTDEKDTEIFAEEEAEKLISTDLQDNDTSRVIEEKKPEDEPKKEESLPKNFGVWGNIMNAFTKDFGKSFENFGKSFENFDKEGMNKMMSDIFEPKNPAPNNQPEEKEETLINQDNIETHEDLKVDSNPNPEVNLVDTLDDLEKFKYSQLIEIFPDYEPTIIIELIKSKPQEDIQGLVDLILEKMCN